jgi:hypothetical protein
MRREPGAAVARTIIGDPLHSNFASIHSDFALCLQDEKNI